MAASTQPQGTTKPGLRSSATPLPKIIPAVIPAAAPIRLIKTDSYKNCFCISADVQPSAFARPISLVRSFTATSIIFINPMADPINVIKAIPIVPISKKAKLAKKVAATLSLLSM